MSLTFIAIHMSENDYCSKLDMDRYDKDGLSERDLNRYRPHKDAIIPTPIPASSLLSRSSLLFMMGQKINLFELETVQYKQQISC
ncbi:MAG: hypothetical protein P4L44_06785 [Oryzomonas sp.]|uniref:hypothetical protein n=1 Tax=Oryzomonas sp. TaxID=2855186 RepID=UPI00284F40FA|nr:hypothetical protein [Oryzomonas sp.]MDR3579649.1 hypothetical protein [Oryzomonas sp.]